MVKQSQLEKSNSEWTKRRWGIRILSTHLNQNYAQTWFVNSSYNSQSHGTGDVYKLEDI